MAGHANGSSGSHAPRRRPVRADTLDLKQKLAIALGENGTKYWQTFVQFCKGSIDRSEFEELAHKSLKPEHGMSRLLSSPFKRPTDHESTHLHVPMQFTYTML